MIASTFAATRAPQTLRPRPQILRGAALSIGLGLGMGLSGCGVTYQSPTVTAREEGTPVRVVPLSSASVAAANRSTAYRPKELPAAFHQLARGSQTARGVGALPQPPQTPSDRSSAQIFRPLPDAALEPYEIGVGDTVLLATRGATSTVEQLSGLLAAQNARQGYTVRDDGTIALPDIGAVKVAGLTVEAAEDRLFQALLDNQIDPSFSLEVSGFNSQRVVVGGDVRTPRTLPLTLTPLTLAEALTAAGGPRAKDPEYATIRVMRDGKIYQMPLQRYLSSPELQSKRLLNGDTIYVDTSYEVDRAMEFYKTQLTAAGLRNAARNSALTALETELTLQRDRLNEQRALFKQQTALDGVARDYVYLAGEVAQQSRFALPYGQQATLADVLYDKGGFDTTTGNPAQIYVLRGHTRQNGQDEVVAYHLNGVNAADLVLATRFEMRPNDILFVEEQVITKWGRALQQMFPALISKAGSAL